VRAGPGHTRHLMMDTSSGQTGRWVVYCDRDPFHDPEDPNEDLYSDDEGVVSACIAIALCNCVIEWLSPSSLRAHPLRY
jgi:hypothetical protein